MGREIRLPLRHAFGSGASELAEDFSECPFAPDWRVTVDGPDGRVRSFTVTTPPPERCGMQVGVEGDVGFVLYFDEDGKVIDRVEAPLVDEPTESRSGSRRSGERRLRASSSLAR